MKISLSIIIDISSHHITDALTARAIAIIIVLLRERAAAGTALIIIYARAKHETARAIIVLSFIVKFVISDICQRRWRISRRALIIIMTIEQSRARRRHFIISLHLLFSAAARAQRVRTRGGGVMRAVRLRRREKEKAAAEKDTYLQ